MKKSLLFVAMSVAVAAGATAEVKTSASVGFDASLVSKQMPVSDLKLQSLLNREVKPLKMEKAELSKPSKVNENLSVAYDAPAGAYYISPNIELAAYAGLNLLVAPYMEYTWMNMSTASGDSSWEYAIGDATSNYEASTYYSNDRDLTFAYDDMVYSSTPTLTIGEKSWNLAVKGRTQSGDYVLSGSVVSSGLPQINSDFMGITAMPFTLYTAITGAGADGNGYWFGDAGREEGITGIGLAFSAPVAPYYLETAYTFATNVSLKNGARLTMTLYDFTNGEKGEVLATGYANANDVTALGSDGEGGTVSSIEFKFYQEDALGGLSQIALSIDKAVYAEISGFGTTDASVESFFLFADVDRDQTEYTNYYLKNCGYISAGEDMFIPVCEYFTTPLYSAPLICFNAILGSFVMDEDVLTFNVAGETKEVAFKSNFIVSTLMTLTELPDWISVGYNDEADQYFVVEVDALPSGVSGRSFDLELGTQYGGYDKIRIQQGVAGVAGVEVSANKVNVVNGNFEVEAASATSVDVYNVAGQKVASAAIEGTTVVPAQDLAKGLYILKFNDNTAVKVMK